MIEGATKVFFDWLRAQEIVPILIVLSIADILSGIAAAFITKTVSSDMSLRGMTKKILMWLAIAVTAAVGKLSPEIPIMNLAASFYCVTEGLSFAENLGRAGVPVPPILKEALSKLNQGVTTTTTTTTTATVTSAPKGQTDAADAHSTETTLTMQKDDEVA